MKLAAARELKRTLRDTFGRLGVSIASGIGLTTTSHFRVAILLHDENDRRLLRHPSVRRAMAAARGEIDVRVIGAIEACSGISSSPQPDTMLRIGASVGHHNGGVGSVGFFATRRSDNKIGLVSCNHVIALADRGVDGDTIVSPSMLDGGDVERDAVATLDGTYPTLGGAGPKVADCAFAALREGVRYDASRFSPEPAEIVEQLAVVKLGRVTGLRRGVVLNIEVDNVAVRYGSVRAIFNDVIEIGSASRVKFSEYGDSGALVISEQTRQPVGLIFATAYVGGPFDAGVTWVNPITHVTTALNVDLVTG